MNQTETVEFCISQIESVPNNRIENGELVMGWTTTETFPSGRVEVREHITSRVRWDDGSPITLRDCLKYFPAFLLS